MKNIKAMKQNNIFRGKGIIASLLLICFTVFGANALTAEQVAQKTAAIVGNSKGVSAAFSITQNGKTVKGTVKTSGSKFNVLLPQVSTWYNGKSLYTYNPRTNETTVITPTNQELLESNPLLYVKGGTGYRYSFSPVKRQGKYVVDVIPTGKKSGITKLTITVNATTFYPERIVITAGGRSTTVAVSSFHSGISSNASEFEYPKNRYPKAEIIDLR